MTRNLLIVGANAAAQSFADRLERHADLGLRVIGHLAGPDVVAFGLTRPVLGPLEQIEDVLHAHVVDEVAICLPVQGVGSGRADDSPVPWRGQGGAYPDRRRWPHVSGGYSEEFDGQRLIALVYGPDRAISLLIERLADLVVAGSALILLSPVGGVGTTH